VVDDVVARLVEHRSEMGFGDGHADGVADALAEWTGGRLDARCVAEFGVSRFPLLGRDGRMVGYLHVKDVLEVADDPAAVVPADRVRGLPEIPSDAGLLDALAALRRSAAHLARVVSVAGGETVGVVAMDDLVQYYVGAVRARGPG